MSTRAPICTLLGLILAAGSVMQAQATFTWTGATTQTVNDGTNTNWLGGAAPVSGNNADLVFGVPANPTLPQSGALKLLANSTFDVASITFNSSFPQYSFFPSTVESTAVLAVGAGGIQSTGSGNIIFSPNLTLQLNASQSWTTSSNLLVFGSISGAFNLTKSGTGILLLGGNSPAFAGNLTVTQGALYLADNQYSAGTGNLIFQSGTTLAPSDTSVSISNNVTVSDGVTFANALGLFNPSPNTPGITIGGSFTAATASIRLHLLDQVSLRLNGALDGPSGTAVTFDSGGTVILAGSTTGAISSITADAAGVVFAAPNTLPSTSIQALNGGYIGVGATSLVPTNVPSPIAMLALITNKAAFNGTFGFDTDPALGAGYTYTDALDFSAFSTSNFKIGSATGATLGAAAVITPPTGGDYRFGNGGGRLVVQSNLTAPVNLIVNSTDLRPLTLVLQGNNSFTGDLTSIQSYVVLDSIGALPSASKIHLGVSGYVSYTPNWGSVPSPVDLISRLSAGYDSTGILGFDSAQPATVPLTVSGPVNLSGLVGPIYLGTTTQGLTLTGTITPPTGGVLEFAGVNQGFLAIASNLTAANGVTSVVIGHPDVTFNKGQEGVGLSGANDYTGGTTLLNGSLSLGNSSALGTGSLTIVNTANNVGITSTSSVALANAVVANNSLVKIDASSSPITFNGTISGPARLSLLGNVTLGTANSYTGGTDIGSISASSPMVVTVNSNTGLGSGDVNFAGMYATVNFTTNVPSIGSLSGGGIVDGIVLPTSATSLAINQTKDGTFTGTISGPAGGATTATLVKIGSNGLVLYGVGNYTGGTLINGGNLAAGNSSALGNGSVTISNDAKLSVLPGVVLTNPIIFGSGGSKLGGGGTFAPVGGLTIGTGTLLTPGNGNISTLTFGTAAAPTNLTWDLGGAFKMGFQNPNGPAGSGTDLIYVNGTLTISSTSVAPFTVSLWTLDPMGNQGVPMAGFNSSQSYNWQVAGASGGILNFDPTKLSLDTSNFVNGLDGGSFSFSLGGGNTALYLNFTPVPEPSTWALMIAGAGAVLFPVFRRRRS